MILVAALLGVLVVSPIWFYLLYEILYRVGASDVMWLLFWVYVPVHLLVAILVKITEHRS